MTKKISLMIITMCLFILSSVSAAEKSTEQKVLSLYNMGFAKGVRGYFDIDSFELNRYATRVEEATVIIRLLGKEKKAAYQNNQHPFYDVPEWASDNIGWLYENYIINGETPTYFGSYELSTMNQFSAMILRVLDYDDNSGDFNYENSYKFACSLGIAEKGRQGNDYIIRSEMFSMCYNALECKMKNSNRYLAEKLCDEGALYTEIAKSEGVYPDKNLSDMFPGVEENLGNITVMTSNNNFKIRCSNAIEEYGIRIFVCEKGASVLREIPQTGAVRFRKGKIEYSNSARAGYVREFTISGLDTKTDYEFIVIKTSSEDEVYKMLGKSSVGTN